MRVGISLASGRRAEDVREGAYKMIERAAASREAGLDSLFVGDHHATPGPYYQNVPIMGRMLAEWGDNPAGCLFLLPLWNPVLLAEQVGTLASIARGRFIIQCGLGRDQEQFDAMGADIRTRPSAFEESLDAVRCLLAGERVSADHRFQFRDAVVNPLPPEPVEFWVGATAEKAIDRAARMGEGWLADPGQTPDGAASLLSYYQERCTAHRREPTAVAIRRDIFVAGTTDEADQVREATRGHRGFPPDAVVCGTIDQVAADFRTYAEMGYTDVIVRHIVDDQDQVLASLARLKEVRAMVAGA
ncbi:MAG: LLM class flavin-dependent oxidoreductase [Dehalococcoidia bacterium]|nr:LLM class flavin-dependent oxidoreductase [Dehalococcoidia bacterium]